MTTTLFADELDRDSSLAYTDDNDNKTLLNAVQVSQGWLQQRFREMN